MAERRVEKAAPQGGRRTGFASDSETPFSGLPPLRRQFCSSFPFYWAISQGLRNPIDTFTVAGLGIPWLSFEPTLDNWISSSHHLNPGARLPTAP